MLLPLTDRLFGFRHKKRIQRITFKPDNSPVLHGSAKGEQSGILDDCFRVFDRVMRCGESDLVFDLSVSAQLVSAWRVFSSARRFVMSELIDRI